MPPNAFPRSGPPGSEAVFRPIAFKDFFLLEQVAFGGMAQIYRARKFGASGFESEVVLKRVLSTLVSNPDFLQMLTNEAKLSAMLSHGNIAHVFEFGLHDGIYYITMEFVEGVSLKEIIRDLRRMGTPLTIAEACYCIIGVLEGLDFAHRKTDWTGKQLGIVHCDVSPDNVVVSYDGVVKVLDFGIARAAGAFSNYKEGMVMGKLNYVAPEQAMAGPVDARTDIFSTGILLYELLTSDHPFGRKGDVSTLIRIARFEKGEITPPRQLNPEVSPELEAIVLKALSGPKSERWPSARHMEMELLKIIQPETPASIAPKLSAKLRAAYQERIEQRRAVRAKDDEIVRELQRNQADDGKAHRQRDPITVVSQPKRWFLPTLLVGVAALGAGFAGGKLLGTVGTTAAVVIADVPQAKLRLDRAAVEGALPIVLNGLKPGVPYLVEVEAEGYKAYSETFQAENGKVTLIKARLEPKARSQNP